MEHLHFHGLEFAAYKFKYFQSLSRTRGYPDYHLPNMLVAIIKEKFSLQ